MKVHIIVEYNLEDKCKIHSVYLHREKADERVFHLIKQNLIEENGKTYHVLKKTVKGNLQKAIKKGLVK